MIVGIPAWQQALLGTLFTWGVTAAGSAVVFVCAYIPGDPQKFLDLMLGFAGGVMVAASYWSLLAPAIEMAERTPLYADAVVATRPDGTAVNLAWLPVAIGFAAGGLFLIASDEVVARLMRSAAQAKQRRERECDTAEVVAGAEGTAARRRRRDQLQMEAGEKSPLLEDGAAALAASDADWRRTLLLVLAITLHNIPEGLAVGVGFGALGTEVCQRFGACSFNSAFNLALGIGIQNFPEGLAVSLPLRRQGVSPWRAFTYGQLSGVVEPFAGLAGAVLVQWVEPLLPYAMSFAAGAMIFVVADDIIPDAQRHGNGRIASVGCMLGFLIMMTLDVALG